MPKSVMLLGDETYLLNIIIYVLQNVIILLIIKFFDKNLAKVNWPYHKTTCDMESIFSSKGENYLENNISNNYSSLSLFCDVDQTSNIKTDLLVHSDIPKQKPAIIQVSNETVLNSEAVLIHEIENNSKTFSTQQKFDSLEDWHEFQEAEQKDETISQNCYSNNFDKASDLNSPQQFSTSEFNAIFKAMGEKSLLSPTNHLQPIGKYNVTKIWKDLEQSRTKSKLKSNWNDSLFKDKLLKSLHLETPFSLAATLDNCTMKNLNVKSIRSPNKQ